MQKMDQALMRWVGISFMLLLMSSIGLAQGSPEQRKPADQQPPAGSQSGQTQPGNKAQQETTPSSTSEGNSTNQPGQQDSAELPQAPQPQTAQETQGQQSPPQLDSTHKPIGAAAAEKEKTSGIAASNPAGVAIAPAKQRRGRAFFIKVGAALGAGAAVGTVLALSRSSPSRPPGSH